MNILDAIEEANKRVRVEVKLRKRSWFLKPDANHTECLACKEHEAEAGSHLCFFCAQAVEKIARGRKFTKSNKRKGKGGGGAPRYKNGHWH